MNVQEVMMAWAKSNMQGKLSWMLNEDKPWWMRAKNTLKIWSESIINISKTSRNIKFTWSSLLTFRSSFDGIWTREHSQRCLLEHRTMTSASCWWLWTRRSTKTCSISWSSGPGIPPLSRRRWATSSSDQHITNQWKGMRASIGDTPSSRPYTISREPRPRTQASCEANDSSRWLSWACSISYRRSTSG